MAQGRGEVAKVWFFGKKKRVTRSVLNAFEKIG